MNSLDEECTPLKTKYDECFNAWFRDSFLKGKAGHEEACGELFKAYQGCLKVHVFPGRFSLLALYIYFYRTAGGAGEAETNNARIARKHSWNRTRKETKNLIHRSRLSLDFLVIIVRIVN